MFSGKFKSYKKNPSVLCTDLDDGAVLLNLDTKDYYTLNSTGLRIWKIMDEVKDPHEIAQKLVIEYEVDSEKAMASIARVMEMLEQEKLIIPLDI